MANGNRSLRFTSGVSVLAIPDTDFWIDYPATYSEGAAPALRVVVNGVWEYADTTETDKVARRVELEDRWKRRTHDLVGKTGLLEIDYLTPGRRRAFADVTLLAATASDIDSNAGLVYSIEFGWPLANGIARVARSLVFGAYAVDAKNFLVKYEAEDRTVWKDVFRAAQIRMYAGPSNKIIRVEALHQLHSAPDSASDLVKRQSVEAILKTWNFEIVGMQAELFLDSVSQGTCHLLSATPSDMTMPDAIVLDLAFRAEYGQGSDEESVIPEGGGGAGGGIGGTLTTYLHIQEEASSVWTVNHGLDGYAYLYSLVKFPSGATLLYFNRVTDNQAQLTFSEAVSGNCVIACWE